METLEWVLGFCLYMICLIIIVGIYMRFANNLGNLVRQAFRWLKNVVSKSL